MLYWLTELSDGGDFFNLFRYITFRAGGAFMTALFGGGSPFWFVAEGALVGLAMGWLCTRFGGEGAAAVVADARTA